jgi:riboflavin kinase
MRASLATTTMMIVLFRGNCWSRFATTSAFSPQRRFAHSPRTHPYTGRATTTVTTERAQQHLFFGSVSSSSNNSENMISYHKKVSTAAQNLPAATNLEEHLQHQKRVFDDMANYFATGQTMAPELDYVYKYLARCILSQQLPTASSSPTSGAEADGGNNVRVLDILDVGCGAGALWPYLAEAAATATDGGVKLKVTGVDVSRNMVRAAADRADALFEEFMFTPHKHNFAVIESDVLQLDSNKGKNSYDLIVVNACFGNFWNQTAVLDHVSGELLRHGGSIVVSHPLGAEFVTKLHEEDAATVPHTLPATASAWTNDLALTLPLELTDLQHPTATIDAREAPFYFTALQKCRARALPTVLRVWGKVDAGYGRGGKKLGFPTANLPTRLFQDALEDVSTGVYFGWALVHGKVHKAVVNIGFSPTFEGQENKEKIIEAHLMPEEPLEDFYGDSMRLELVGYLRPEIKFPSFPDLIAQINKDVKDAKEALDREPYSLFREDSGFFGADPWVGSNGGDDKAGWEFANVRDVLDTL